MLRNLRQHPMLVAMTEVLSNAVRYIAIMLVVITILAWLAF